jgi:ferredoxin--NADP+ reductase
MAKRNYDTLVAYSKAERSNASRTIRLRFLASPVELSGEDGRVRRVRIERNKLVVDDLGSLRAKGTGAFETIEAGLVLRAVGYRTAPLPGIPYDETTSTLMNVAGRLAGSSGDEEISGAYVVGWAKRGPSGVIGTNKADAVGTVAAMVADVPALEGIRDEDRDPAGIVELLDLRRPDYVTYDDWRILDQYEIARGAAEGRPRVKVTSVPEMLDIIAQHAVQG